MFSLMPLRQKTNIVSIFLQTKEKMFHEMAFLLPSKSGTLSSPRIMLFLIYAIYLGKNHEVSLASCCCKNKHFLTLDLWSDVNVWILISVSFFISRQLLPLKMENHKCVPDVRYFPIPMGLCYKAFWWSQFVHQIWDAMAHWATSIFLVIDAYLTQFYIVITQFNHYTKRHFRHNNYVIVKGLWSEFPFWFLLFFELFFIYSIKYYLG